MGNLQLWRTTDFGACFRCSMNRPTSANGGCRIDALQAHDVPAMMFLSSFMQHSFGALPPDRCSVSVEAFTLRPPFSSDLVYFFHPVGLSR